MSNKIEKTDAQWQALLKEKGAEPLAFEVTRHAATEPAYTGQLTDNKAAGSYHCICCGKPLFDSSAKYESGCGWPSYFQPLDQTAVNTRADDTLHMHRIEVLCADCGAHLGHVFADGPAPTGLRYCINSASLNFRPT